MSHQSNNDSQELLILFYAFVYWTKMGDLHWLYFGGKGKSNTIISLNSLYRFYNQIAEFAKYVLIWLVHEYFYWRQTNLPKQLRQASH